MRVLIAGGGTGGHLFPGIALARELQRRRPDTAVWFAGTSRGIEARVLPREGFPLETIRVAGLKGTSVAARLRGLLLLPRAALDAWRAISRVDPDVVVGVGGFASGPVVALAALRGRPTMLLEQNARPGLTNRLLAPLVDAAAVNFDVSLRFFPRTGFVAGNPVRPEFFLARGAEEASAGRQEANGHDGVGQDTPPDAARVLIVGGSQGAHAINMAMVEAASRLAAAGRPLAIAHQTGERDLDVVRAAYERVGVQARVEAFIHEMDREMREADVVVCRAGATTLAELGASGRPAILVPLPTAADDHQRRNAEVFGRAGAAIVVDQADLTGERLAAEVAALAEDAGRRGRMSAAARQLARPDAARRIADRVEQLGHR